MISFTGEWILNQKFALRVVTSGICCAVGYNAPACKPLTTPTAPCRPIPKA